MIGNADFLLDSNFRKIKVSKTTTDTAVLTSLHLPPKKKPKIYQWLFITETRFSLLGDYF